VPYKYKKWKARDETRQQVTKEVTKLDEKICKSEQKQNGQKIPDLFDDSLLVPSPNLSRYEITRSGETAEDLAEPFQYDELIWVHKFNTNVEISRFLSTI